MELPLKCNMTLLNIRSETVDILDFEFTLKVSGTPKVMQLLGGQHIYFNLKDFEIKDYIDNLPGEVVDRYMISRIEALSKKILPEDITFFDN